MKRNNSINNSNLKTRAMKKQYVLIGLMAMVVQFAEAQSMDSQVILPKLIIFNGMNNNFQRS